MIPDSRETFVNGNIRIDVDNISDGGKNIWLTLGIGALQIQQSEFLELIELLTALREEFEW